MKQFGLEDVGTCDATCPEYVVTRNWVGVMAVILDDQSGCGQEVSHQNSLFYADYGMVALSDLIWLQGAFSTLLGLFYRMKGQEECRNGLPPVPGGENAFGGSVQATDDRIGAFLPGNAACLGTLRGVWGGYGVGVAGSPQKDE